VLGCVGWQNLVESFFFFSIVKIALGSGVLPHIDAALAALMENQVANLQKKNVKCNFLSSTKTAQERSSILQDIKSAAPALRLLFITPELLSTEGFMGILKAMNSRGTLTLFAVDEAHCISSWYVKVQEGALGNARSSKTRCSS